MCVHVCPRASRARTGLTKIPIHSLSRFLCPHTTRLMALYCVVFPNQIRFEKRPSLASSTHRFLLLLCALCGCCVGVIHFAQKPSDVDMALTESVFVLQSLFLSLSACHLARKNYLSTHSRKASQPRVALSQPPLAIRMNTSPKRTYWALLLLQQSQPFSARATHMLILLQHHLLRCTHLSYDLFIMGGPYTCVVCLGSGNTACVNPGPAFTLLAT